MWFVLVIGLAMIGVAWLTLREIVAFLHKRDSYPLRRLTLRIVTALMLMFLLGSVLVGIRYFHLGSPEESGNPHHWMAFWGCISLLTGAIFCLVIADFRTISEESNHDANRLWRDIAQTIADHEIKKTSEE